MGSQQLETVLTLLRNAGFSAELAYPGRSIPRITTTVAAVHLENVDTENATVTVEVYMICPQSLGGSTCESAALTAIQALSQAGAVCIQDGCVYDRVSQVYRVSIHALFSSITGTTSPAFSVYIDGLLQAYPISFREDEDTGCQPEYAIGDAFPIGSGTGSRRWVLELEEQIPPGASESTLSDKAFTMVVDACGIRRTYSGCRWTSATREFTRDGLRRVRKGFAMSRREASNG